MNNIQLATIYLPMLDEVYKAEAKTSILDGDETTVKKGSNGEIKIAKLDMDGLGNFDRKSGYTQGSTSFTWETVKYDKERSQELRIDRLDNEEALKMPFARLSSEFIRTKVVPETDAARIAKLCGTEGITKKNEDLATGADVITALRASVTNMDNNEVSTENRILFIRPELKQAVDDMDTNKSKAVLSRFSEIIEVPATRMYSAITLNDGESNYGYVKAGGAKDVNFLVVEKSAAVCAMDQFIKYFTPDQDQKGDSHVFNYRNNNLYGHVYENKLAGVYASIAN